MVGAVSALKRLQDGNLRFVSGLRSVETMMMHEKCEELTAVILGCPDSRVPAVILFDQGLDDLFVLCVADKVVAP